MRVFYDRPCRSDVAREPSPAAHPHRDFLGGALDRQDRLMGWLANWRRRRVLAKHRIEDPLWLEATTALSFMKNLSPREEEKLKSLVILFLAEKQLAGVGGIEMSDAMRVSIAAQACLPILELGLDWYSGWTGVVLYPGDFRVRRSELDEDGVLHEWEDELAGEAMPGGPVVLSWDAAANDPLINVVIHEFAHKLDMLSGEPNGVPPLHAGMSRRAWLAALNEAFEGFSDALERGRDTWLDPYAAEHPSEFFAVISEAFFQQPKETQRRYPDFYDQLKLFYKQDPASRV
jgi:Mlc titration factor MtfA (ptsG expression regulator)